MNLQTLQENIQGIDIYILDQLLKDRYQPGDKILDAGCGRGRNLKWFYNTGFEVYGIDMNIESIDYCKGIYSKQKEHFMQAGVEEIPFESNSFNHVICNAVLHFAKNKTQFNAMFNELFRVLKPKGSLLIRVASNFGIENQVRQIAEGVYKLPDGSTRFLLTADILDEIKKNEQISLIEDVKTTIVENKRSMTTLVFIKK